MNIELDCGNCGKSYSLEEGRDLVCTDPVCRITAKEKAKHNVSCYICEKTFYIKPSHLAKRVNKDKITCSRACNSLARKELMSGANNHQFGLKGELNSTYLSDIRTSSYGYILVRNSTHPASHADGYMLLHRLVYEEYLRSVNEYTYLVEVDNQWILNPMFIIHHIDGNRLNNSLSNLELTSLEEHSARHSEDRTSINRFSKAVGELKEGRMFRNKRLDAGQDVTSSESLIVPANGSAVVPTGLVINVPEGYVGLLWSRSGLSVKHKIEVGAGCIDSGYTGEILVHLYNHSSTDYTISIGDKIAQLLTIPINLNDYKKVDQLSNISARGSSGFGSSGY